MKWDKIVCGLLVFGMSCILLCNTAFASGTRSTDKVTNHGRMGAVDISISHAFTDETVNLMPNQEVGIESSVDNIAEPSWIRARIDYPYFNAEHGKVEQMELPNDALITFADENWKQIGEWYYYLKPVDSGANVPFTESIMFPADWDNSYVDASFDMEFTAEAIQEKNFIPDFDSDDPWHGVIIQAFDSDNYQFGQVSDDHFQVVYEGGSKGLVHAGEDFFANWGNVMPGDSLSGDAEISNKMDVPIKLYFEADAKGETDILDALHLKITNGDQVVFDDVLSKKLDKTLLAVYEPNQNSAFHYELTVPAKLDNTYAMEDFQAIWTFSCEEAPEESMVSKLVERIDTGDIRLYGAVAIGLISVISLLIGLVRKVVGRRG